MTQDATRCSSCALEVICSNPGRPLCSSWRPKDDACAGEQGKQGKQGKQLPGPITYKPESSTLAVQVGGNHYKNMPIQPVEYIHKNGIGYFEGCVIKYVSRWKNKNGLEDLKKARHFLDLLIELEGANG